MPRIKRWGPFAHGFNRDPQVRELRRQFGDWMGFVWLELCAIGDLNGGIVKGTPEQIGESLAYISMSKRPSLSAKQVTNALQFMLKCGWIAIQTDYVLIVNHLKYHPFENSNAIPPNDRTTERPNLKNEKPATPEPSAHPQKEEPKKLDPAIKAIADPIYRSDPGKYLKLIVWIKDKEKRDYPGEVIVSALNEFWTHEQKSKVKDWWPYLEKIFRKEFGRWNEEQAQKVKSQDRAFILNLVDATSRKMSL